MKPNVMDLFAGCGGLSCGLAQVGFNVQWASEIDSDAAETYAKYHKGFIWAEDAANLLVYIAEGDARTPRKGDVDLLAGGPPCQGFSGYNRYRSPSDPRNSMLELFLSFVEVLQPRYVLIENVPGMLQMSGGNVIRLLLASLEGLGYQTRLTILQAGHYGVPQNRWRIFVLAAKGREQLPEAPDPTHIFPRTTIFGATDFRRHVVRVNDDGPTLFGSLLPTITVGDATYDLPLLENGGVYPEGPYNAPPKSSYQSLLRKGSTVLTNHSCKSLGNIMMERVVAIPRRPGSGWIDLPNHLKPKNLLRHGDDRYPNRFGRLWWDGTFNTIVSEANPYWGRVIHPEQDRVISVRESARAQGLPDDMKIYGPLTSQYRQVGNAVPSPLGVALGREIMKAMGLVANEVETWAV